MREDSWKEYLLYLPLSIIILLTRVLPVKAVLNLGVSIGRMVHFFSWTRRRVCNNNLKAAYGQNLGKQERDNIIKQIFENFGLNILELFLMPRMSDVYFKKYTKVTNLDYVTQGLKKGKGIIFLSAHYGNWEICASISANHGYRMYALARVQKPYFLNDLLNHYRELRGTMIIQKGMQLREIVKNLRKNGIVGMIGDQSGRQGKEMDFFGRPIFMAEGAFRIAATTESVIIPAFNIRKGFSHNLVMEKPIQIKAGESADDFVNRAMLEYRDLLESYIRQNPHLWLWGNRRWKYTRARSVLILNDGKTGHLRQAQAVAHSVASQMQPTKIAELDVLFKDKTAERLLNFITLCFGHFISNPLRYLKFTLEPASYEKLEQSFSDIIICTGSSTRAVALLLGKENSSKTISIMNPTPFPKKRFDLSIIPYHDNPRPDRHVLITHGALNMVSPERLKEDRSKLAELVDLKDGLRIGVLIGGDSKYYSIDVDFIKELLDQLKKFADESKAQLLISTSRRTSGDVDEYIKKSLKNYPRCDFVVFPNEKNFDFAVNGILGASNVVIVTGESVSMVSEAATSDAYPIVLRPKGNFKVTKIKHEIFLEHLAKSRIIRYATLKSIYEELVCFKERPHVLKKLDDLKKLDRVIKDKILR